MRSYIFMWKRMFDFKGTTTVGEFWVSILFNIIVSIALTYATGMLSESLENAYFILPIYSFLTILPIFSMTIRRIRDADRSPANILWLFIPLLGWLILLMVLLSKSRAERDREFDRYHW